MRRLTVALSLAVLCAAAGAQHTGTPVSMVFVGDVMLDDTPGRVVRSGRDPFAHVAHWLRDADVRVANLESIVATTGTPEPDKPYTFRAHPRVMGPLRRHFDAVGLANNHAGDYGPEALVQTLGLLDRHGISHFGAGTDLARAHTPLIIERSGLRIALLGYNEFFPRSFEADVDRPGIAWSEDAQVRHDIALARSQHRADLVIPVMHWGWEYEPLARPRQRALARLMIEAGADAVVGGHPHVTQDIEIVDGKPVFYSLGNFVFDGFTETAHRTGWLLRMELDREGVRRWRTRVVRMDREGLPRPHAASPGDCWARGDSRPRPCTTP
jgi:poly-gamma-glutamate capsule biosynthesis protein CapA/YwtB (metallophosphatase superfamily)